MGGRQLGAVIPCKQQHKGPPQDSLVLLKGQSHPRKLGALGSVVINLLFNVIVCGEPRHRLEHC